jgi:hypothetical protein
MTRAVCPVRRMLMIGTAASAFAMVASRPLRALEHVTKEAARYQDTPNGIQMCANCSLFVEPSSCKLVEGDISPNGWCKDYVIVD